jgi:Tfp pilus assembly protein PilX
MRHNKRLFTEREEGAVAIFIVIFFALLLSVITLGFVRLTNQDQEQALITDLSQSAFDAAESGVEDAKRAIVQYRKVCSGGLENAQCQAYINAFKANKCNTLSGPLAAQLSLVVDDKGAVKVITNATDTALSQSYTCLKVALETADYVRKIEADTSDLIPLRGSSNFNSVTINWFLAADAGLTPGSQYNLPHLGGPYGPIDLPSVEQWGQATPPVMRVQLIEHNKDTFTQAELEDNSSTLFLYPSESGGAINNQVPFTRYARKSPSEPVQITCTKDTGGYACAARLQLTGSLAMNPQKVAYLRVTPLYKGATFQLQLNDGAVTFDGVQPSVDSTGRANDVFRRVQSRIRFDEATGSYPENALDVTSDICKDFVVSSQPLTAGSCQPKNP